MVETYLVSTLLMGLVLVATAAALMRSDQVGSTVGPSSERDGSTLSRLAGSPSVWLAGFLLIALGLGGAAVVFAAGPELLLDEATAETIGLVVGGLLAGLLAMFLFASTYVVVRNRGFGPAHATAAVLWIAGLLLIVVISVHLIENL